MGLFKFLKEKFSKKKEEKEEKLVEKEVSSYDKGLEKSRENFSKRISILNKKFKSRKIDDEFFNDLEEILIEADCGVSFTLNIIEQLVEITKKEKLTDTKEITEKLIDLMFENYKLDDSILNLELKDGLNVLLVVGVNGVGKTTTIAKIANLYKKQNKKVLLAAADTFRAGATEQLEIWASRIGVDIVTGSLNEDPSSVAFKGVSKAKKENYDLVIVDTAGRLQNKSNLMDELAKIKRVILKNEPDNVENMLIIDATTGQNGVLQAKAFKELIDINYITITKMDGTSKGGIILAIKEELDIPVKFIGLGETLEDLKLFDLHAYLYGLCKELIEDDE